MKQVKLPALKVFSMIFFHFYKGETTSETSCLNPCMSMPLKNESFSYWKEFAHQGSKFFSIRGTLSKMGAEAKASL